jgi:predicted RNA-binding protein with PIN domain
VQKVEAKLVKAREELTQLQAANLRYRRECEELRGRLQQNEAEFESQMAKALADERARWFERYRSVDGEALERADRDLEKLIERADRALELQQEADLQFGTVSAVRRKLLKIKLYLEEIERVFSDSLMVHTEVVKVKEALIAESRRLLDLPNIGKVLAARGEKAGMTDLTGKIHLLDPESQNLIILDKLEKHLESIAQLGFSDDLAPLLDAVQHKRQQILEALYARFEAPQGVSAWSKRVGTFDDFVATGKSKTYDLFIDGYNLLLSTRPGQKAGLAMPIATLREELIRALCSRSHSFRRIYLVFDGVEESRERQGNVEIVYSNKVLGNTADTVIVQALSKSRDRRAILVTADRAIIEATEGRIYAVLSPFHLYHYLFGNRSSRRPGELLRSEK